MGLGQIIAGAAAVHAAAEAVDWLNSWLSGVAFAWPNCNTEVVGHRGACYFLDADYFMVTEEGTGNVRIYPYRNRNDANEGMDYGVFGFMIPSRILFNYKGEE